MMRHALLLWLAASALCVPSRSGRRGGRPRRPMLQQTCPQQSSMLLGALRALEFDNSALRELKVDAVSGGPPRNVCGAHLVRVMPSPLKNPVLVAVSEDALELLGLPMAGPDDLEQAQQLNDDLADIFSGNELLPQSEPSAACYCGHQFGKFVGQLGDGAAISLGEVLTSDGERIEMQLKGAGPTPFSRVADGRKVLRSSIREFLCSEAMYHLGIPTTRALALVVSDTRATRDARSNGQYREERCAVLVRLACGYIRFGSFEVCYRGGAVASPSEGLEEEVLVPLLDYTIARHFSHLRALHPERADRYAAFFAEVVSRTAKLVAAWQAVGFVHGVLNTDNMAITGDTIDFGPFGFMDAYDANYIPNSSDAAGRYCYRAQPEACFWNLERLAESLEQLVSPAAAQTALAAFWVTYEAERRRRFRNKLGLLVVDEGEDDDALLDSMLELMKQSGADFTNCFRALSREPLPLSEADCYTPPPSFDATFEYLLAQCSTVEGLLKRTRPLFDPTALARLRVIAEQEPEQLTAYGISTSLVLRETARATRREQLSRLTTRSKRRSDAEHWRDWLQRYRRRLWRERCAVQQQHTCTLEGDGAVAQCNEDIISAAAIRRVTVMNGANPCFVLRQHIAARAIERAEAGDYNEVQAVLELLRRPYEEQGHALIEKYAMLPPDWAQDLVLT